jgi:hypothetical protein
MRKNKKLEQLNDPIGSEIALAGRNHPRRPERPLGGLVILSAALHRDEQAVLARLGVC